MSTAVSSQLSPETLRCELERFFKEAIRPELLALAERLEKSAQDETHHCLANGLATTPATPAEVETSEGESKQQSLRDLQMVPNVEKADRESGKETALLLDLAESEHSYAGINDGSSAANCHAISHSFWLGGLTCLFIFINAIQLGIMTDYSLSTGSYQAPFWLCAIDTFFALFFALELALQLFVRGTGYFTGLHRNFHMIDCTLVTVQLVDVILTLLIRQGLFLETLTRYCATMRMLRWTRLIRLYRVTKLLHIFELQMLVVTVGGSLRTLIWVILALFTVTYMCALYICEVVADRKLVVEGEISDDEHLVLHYFGTVTRTLITLYQIVSDGDNWGRVMDPLHSFSSTPWVILFFILYVSFTFFGLLNVITGIFLNSAMQTAEDDKRRSMVKQMRRLFVEADKDGSGMIDWEEFCRELAKPEMTLYLKSIDLRADHGRDLFNLLDVDGSGEISIDEFVSGCLKLHGNTKALDFATFKNEQDLVNQRVEKQMNRIEQLLGGARRESEALPPS